MREWFAGDPARAVRLIRRCEQLGINTCQMGGEAIERALRLLPDAEPGGKDVPNGPVSPRAARNAAEIRARQDGDKQSIV